MDSKKKECAHLLETFNDALITMQKTSQNLIGPPIKNAELVGYPQNRVVNTAGAQRNPL